MASTVITATLPHSDVTADVIIAGRSGPYGVAVRSRLWDGAHIAQTTCEWLYMDYCPAEIVALELEKLFPAANLAEALASVELEYTCPCECGECDECGTA